MPSKADDDRDGDTTVDPIVEAITVGPEDNWRFEGHGRHRSHFTTDADGNVTYNVADDMFWGDSASTYGNPIGLGGTDGPVPGNEGLKIQIDPNDTDDAVDGVQTAVQYLPMHSGDGAEFKFYGYIETDETDGGDSEPFQELGTALQPDEDQGSGRNSDDVGEPVAPWLTVAVLDANAVLQYVVYHTSEREVLAGGRTLDEYNGTNNPALDMQPAFTADEGADTVPATDR